ncbi:MAG: phenylacetic acid degradation protein [Proteobacteria bacterium SG_bin9]|nr:MAG: phenylacetic acid degradation protein [Proteobacteria bacterium SG_bin9]
MNAPIVPPIQYGVTPMPTMAALSGLDFIQAMLAGKFPAPPIMRTLGFTLGKADKGTVEFQSTPSFDHYNPIGSVHGGYAATLLDSAMGCAVHTVLPAGQGYTTLEFKVNFVRGMTVDTGPIRTIGTVLNAGRRTAIAEGKILDAQDRLIAHATTTCLVFELPVKGAAAK